MSTFPTSPLPVTFDVESNQPVIVNVSESGKRQARLIGGHRWLIKLTYPVMEQSTFAPFDAFIMSMDGQLTSFDYTSPVDNLGTWISATPSVNGIHASGAETVSMNLTAGLTVKAGDIWRPAGHNKVYKIVADAVSVADVISISIKPALISALADLEAVTHTSVIYHVAIKNKFKFKTTKPMHFKFSLELEEAL